MRVRRALFDDLAAIVAISNRAAVETAANFAIEPETVESWQRSFRETSAMYPWLVATDDDDRALGFAKASPWKGRCAYTYSAEISVYVQPEHHGRGLGRALYTTLLATLAAQGYRSVLGGITLPNPASVRLHESFGLRRVAVFERIGWKFDRWHDVGYWQGSLGDAAAPPGRLRPVEDVYPAAD